MLSVIVCRQNSCFPNGVFEKNTLPRTHVVQFTFLFTTRHFCMLRLPFDKKNEKAEQNKLEIRIYETTCSSLRVLDFINERRCNKKTIIPLS